MSPLEKKIVEKRLHQLEETLQELMKISPVSKEHFIRNQEIQWAVERGLQLAIQQVIDIGSHILVSANHNNVNDYADVGRKLGKHNIIPIEFSERVVSMIKFRNLLIHEYVHIEPEKVYEILQESFSDFEKFIEYIKSYLF